MLHPIESPAQKQRRLIRQRIQSDPAFAGARRITLILLCVMVGVQACYVALFCAVGIPRGSVTPNDVLSTFGGLAVCILLAVLLFMRGYQLCAALLTLGGLAGLLSLFAMGAFSLFGTGDALFDTLFLLSAASNLARLILMGILLGLPRTRSYLKKLQEINEASKRPF